MGIIRQYIVYVDYGLAALAGILFIGLLIRTGKMKSTTDIIGEDSKVLGRDLRHMNETIDSIRATEDSWKFFASLYIIFVVIKETLRYRRSDRSISKSFTRSVARHAKELSSIKIHI